MGLALLEQRIVDRTVRLVLQHPFLGKLAVLNLFQDALHLLLRLVRNDPRPARDIAVFRRRADRVAHVRDAALVDQVHDQLHFVQTLEVGHLGRIPRFNERLVAGLDQRRQPAAEHHLLAEEIGLRFLAEVRLDDAGPSAADRAGIGQPDLAGIPARVLVDCQQAGHAAALRVFRPDEMPGAFWRHHEHVDAGRRDDLAEMDVETMPERQVGAVFQMRRDGLAVDGRLRLVRRQDHHHVRRLHRVGHRHHFQPALLRLLPRAALAKADDDVDAAFLQVQRMRVPLAAVADDGHLLVLDLLHIGVFVVIDLHDSLLKNKGSGRWAIGDG